MTKAPMPYEQQLAALHRNRHLPTAQQEPTVKPKKVAKRLLDASQVQAIFKQEGGAKFMPAARVIDSMVTELNRNWAEEPSHGLWALHCAIRVVLDDALVAATIEARHRSKLSRQRESAYRELAAAAQKLAGTGVRLPLPDELSPENKQATVVANPFHRDWETAFRLVARGLKSAGMQEIARSALSPAVRIASGLLKRVGIPVEPESLSKMLYRQNIRAE